MTPIFLVVELVLCPHGSVIPAPHEVIKAEWFVLDGMLSVPEHRGDVVDGDAYRLDVRPCVPARRPMSSKIRAGNAAAREVGKKRSTVTVGLQPSR